MAKFVITLTLLAVMSCVELDGEDCSPENVWTGLTPGKEIIIQAHPNLLTNWYSVVDGEHLLFHYSHTAEDCKNVRDDEWQENLLFIVDKDATSFEVSDDALREIKCYYYQDGAWTNSTHFEITDGSIKGTKINDNTWDVTVSIKTPSVGPAQQAQMIEFSGTFGK
jgi:hypothetical protein